VRLARAGPSFSFPSFSSERLDTGHRRPLSRIFSCKETTRQRRREGRFLRVPLQASPCVLSARVKLRADRPMAALAIHVSHTKAEFPSKEHSVSTFPEQGHVLVHFSKIHERWSPRNSPFCDSFIIERTTRATLRGAGGEGRERIQLGTKDVRKLYGGIKSRGILPRRVKQREESKRNRIAGIGVQIDLLFRTRYHRKENLRSS